MIKSSQFDNLEALDLSSVSRKMIYSFGWHEDEIKQCERFYRNFLFLKLKYGLGVLMPPNLEIDEFWHNHILDTKKYIQDCNNIFRQYVHHYPYAGMDFSSVSKEELQNAFWSNTQKLHNQEFGHYIYKIRPTFLELNIEVLQRMRRSTFGYARRLFGKYWRAKR